MVAQTFLVLRTIATLWAFRCILSYHQFYPLTMATTVLDCVDLSISTHFPSSNVLNNFWEQALDEYKAKAKLTQKEMDTLKCYNGPLDVFDLTKFGWEKNIVQKQWSRHETAKRTVGQILGVIGTMDSTIGLVNTYIASQYYNLINVLGLSTIQGFVFGYHSFSTGHSAQKLRI